MQHAAVVTFSWIHLRYLHHDQADPAIGSSHVIGVHSIIDNAFTNHDRLVARGNDSVRQFDRTHRKGAKQLRKHSLMLVPRGQPVVHGQSL